MQNTPPTIDFFSVFQLIYDLFFGFGHWDLYGFLGSLRPFTTFLSLCFIAGTIYAFMRFQQVRSEEALYYESKAAEGAKKKEKKAAGKNDKWERVLAHIASENPSDWRLAILECDVILEEMAEVMGYRGENLGEKLKNVERSDFTKIDQAWEAHKVRNMIAHEGSDFLISEREARRVVGLYQQVFEEFKYI
jgi:cbb3-type cytochrome oxidase subunit 3